MAKLSWTHHRTIFSRCKVEEEREYYIRMSIKENYSVRELDRQISASLFERAMLGNTNISTALKEFGHDLTNTFKVRYIFEFLNLPEFYSENDLQKGLIKQMKKFILELGKDFIFINEEYKVRLRIKSIRKVGVDRITKFLIGFEMVCFLHGSSNRGQRILVHFESCQKRSEKMT